jgi:ATP-dependent helicase/nuclease subunit A
MMASPSDDLQRQKALDIDESFIVQAPAGSGKTALLIQRFLALLATVEVPEKVVAITFTRKAAAEMRTRIGAALQHAALRDPPEASHAFKTWQLAKNVLKIDELAHWNLRQNPNRLKILTIDALCARIVKSAPLIANLSLASRVVPDPTPFYREAVQALLTEVDHALWVEALKKLLLHLDNNYLLTETLFIKMLSRRDQWLPYVVNNRAIKNLREVLEVGLKNIITDTLRCAAALFSEKDKEELISLINFSNQMLKRSDDKLINFPAGEIEDYPAWTKLSRLLLTTAFEWRRTVNKNCGFPAASEAINKEEGLLFKSKKESMLKLLLRLSTHESLRVALKDCLLLPPPTYSEKQWEIISALNELLPILVRHLNLIFQSHNVTGFISISNGAIHALQGHDLSNGKRLNLDYPITHLLVDEFQDISVTQYRLLELLTREFDKKDGQTLFLVGDPMQSIYRFREAEVGIFLRVRKFGIGNIKLVPLVLEVNFRSKPHIVAWFNQTFAAIFPAHENSELGAIPFSKSRVFSNEEPLANGVETQLFLNSSQDEEANYIVSLLKKEAVNTKKTIAILVRSRSHLRHIIPALKKANLNFRAVEIERLIYSSAVQDLFTLTKAIFHTGDRIAWLAILRAPWCGLTLADLYLIANHDTSKTIWETIQHFTAIPGLSLEGMKRLARNVPVLANALKERSRGNLRTWVAYTWYALGGPACLDEEADQNVESYFKLLESFLEPAPDFKLLEQKLMNSYAHCASPHANIHLMTLHKAKGLEFDTVIIPGLARKPVPDENHLLMWLERENRQGKTELILAPIKLVEEDFDPIYRYIRTQNSLKSQYELLRLLYVGVTRAKARLYLLGTIERDNEENKIKLPARGSFLRLLWPSIRTECFEKIKENHKVENEVSMAPVNLGRLVENWKTPLILPPVPTGLSDVTTGLSDKASYQFSWSMDYLNHVGTIIHQFFQKACNEKLFDLDSSSFEEEKKDWEKKLIQLGVVKIHLAKSLDIIEKAIRNTWNDARGQWILSHKHHEAKNEFSVSMCENNKVINYIIDRTFVDEVGIRWIIDYKTSELKEDAAGFLERAKLHYAPQLENYAKVMKQLDHRPIKLGLYFPLFSGWSEWDYPI